MISDFRRLIRPRVSLAVAAGSMFGVFYHGGAGPVEAVLAPAGAFLLCGACSVWNQIQERGPDARMERTRNRPLVSDRVSVLGASLLAGLLFLFGLGSFFLAGGWPLFLLGLAITAVYNGVYTPLKRVTPAALLAGGFAGAVPPLTGWMAAGGQVLDPRILAVTIIFYLWQVPHFWLLAEKQRADYERAGFAVLAASLSPAFRARLMGVWVGAYFVGLGCLTGLAGPMSLQWIVPPVLLLAGGMAAGMAAGGRLQIASVAMYVSLPLGLIPLLMHTL